MRFFSALLVLLLCFTAHFAVADSIRLFEWIPGNTLAPLILPVREHETPEDAAKRYLDQILRTPDLAELFQGQTPDLPLKGFKLLEGPADSKALLLANLPKDYTRDTLRVQNFVHAFSKASQVSYILPLNADLGLTLSESREFLKILNQRFSLMVAMGGDDTYSGAERTESIHSRNVNRSRDLFEAKVILSYIKAETGFFLGVCRGSQIAARVLGYNLNPDIPLNLTTADNHRTLHSDHWHPIKLLETRHQILKKIAKTQKAQIEVNSLHHQGVLWKPGGPLELSAVAPDGTTEATEFKNGKGVLLQFHPELMNTQLGSSILTELVTFKNLRLQQSCGRAFIF